MLQRLVNIVEPKTRNGFPRDLRQLLNSQHSFVDSYHAIEDYARVNRMEIPDRILVEHLGSYMHDPTLSSNGIGIAKNPSTFSFNNESVGRSDQLASDRETLINQLPREENRTLTANHSTPFIINRTPEIQSPTVFNYHRPI